MQLAAQTEEKQDRPTRLIRESRVMEMLGVGRTNFHTRFLKDPNFPKAKLIGSQKRWRESDIEDYIDMQPDYH